MGSERERIDRSGSADRHIPRSSGAERIHMNADDRVLSGVVRLDKY
jgi:hypothetical protein